jgi:hypothetical protein
MRIEIDHVTFCASSLDKLREAFAGVGLSTDYGGPHAHGCTHMALIGFEDGSYVELIAPLKQDWQASGLMGSWAKLMRADAGAGAWAVRTRNIQAEVDRLRGAGVVVAPPEYGGRKTIDGGLLRWQTSTVGSGPAGVVLPFMIQDETPRELRVRLSDGARDSGLTGVGRVIVAVRDLEAAISLFCKAYGWESPDIETPRDFGARLAYFPDTPVILARPLDDDSWLARRLNRLGNGPVAFLLQGRDLEAAKHRFSLTRESRWFGRRFAWFDEEQLHGARLGVMQQGV